MNVCQVVWLYSQVIGSHWNDGVPKYLSLNLMLFFPCLNPTIPTVLVITYSKIASKSVLKYKSLTCLEVQTWVYNCLIIKLPSYKQRIMYSFTNPTLTAAYLFVLVLLASVCMDQYTTIHQFSRIKTKKSSLASPLFFPFYQSNSLPSPKALLNQTLLSISFTSAQ